MQSVSARKRLVLLALAAFLAIANPASAAAESSGAHNGHPSPAQPEAGAAIVEEATGDSFPRFDTTALKTVPMVVSFERLEKMGRITMGWFCSAGSDLAWLPTEKTAELTKMLDDRLRKYLKAKGFVLPEASLDLFGGGSDLSRFMLGATIDKINVAVCIPGGQKGNDVRSKGSASIAVTWKLYSKAERKVVMAFKVQGDVDEPKGVQGEMLLILMHAFDKAIDQLFASSEFQAYLAASRGGETQ